jgi:hypothetical protein
MGEKINKYEYMLSCFINGNNGEIRADLKKFSKRDLCEFLLYYQEQKQIKTAYEMRSIIMEIQDRC